MSRKEEYWTLIQTLNETPAALDGAVDRARARARRARAGRRFKYTSGPATQCFKQIREQGLNGQDFCGMIEHALL